MTATVVLLVAGTVSGQIVSPLTVGNSTPVKDALGRNLPGSWADDPSMCSRVEIREVGIGIVPPNPETGAGNDAINPVLVVSRLGMNVPNVPDPGRFEEVLNNRLPDGKSYFARVYDASAVSQAVYYANSAPFQDVAPELRNTVTSTNVTFQSLRRVDGQEDVDTDEDGIPDTLERDLGTDPDLEDTDEDFFDDGFEVVHNMNPLEPYWFAIDLLNDSDAQGSLSVATGNIVAWESVPGVAYRLEYSAPKPDEALGAEVWSGVATETNTEFGVDSWVQTNSFIHGFFRVWASQPASP